MAAGAISAATPTGTDRSVDALGGLARHVGRRLATLPLPSVWLLAVGILILRSPQAQLIYEDGRQWFVEARLHGPWWFLHSYAGYLQIPPRAVGLLEASLPAAWAPYVSTAFAMSLVGLIAVAAYRLWPPLALAVVLLPNTGHTMGSPTFLHFFLAIGLAIGLFVERVGRIGRLGLAFCSVAGPFGILLTPPYAVRWFLVRDRDSAWRLVSVALPALAQIVVLLIVGHRPDVARNTSVLDGLSIAASHLTTMILGSRIEYAARLVPLWVGAAVAAAITVLLILVLIRLPRAVAGVVVYLVVVTVVATMVAGTTDAASLLGPQSAARYFFAVGAVIAGAVLFGAARGGRAAAILVCLIALGWIGDFAVDPLPPSAWATESACFDTPGPCTVHVFPGGVWDIHWGAARSTTAPRPGGREGPG
jgi:hypothetical protein